MRLILASASPRRAELLRAAGYDFDIVVTDVDESVRDGEPPSMYVRRLAAEKSAAALAVIERGSERPGALPEEQSGSHQPHRQPARKGPAAAWPFPGGDSVIVLGADTTVVVDGDILAKPRDDAEAAAMLKRLSGRRHEVMTGVSLRCGAYELGRVETSGVWFAALSDDDIAWYVASGEGRDKAGAYAIQGLASRFVPRLEGSYTNVVGLPIPCVRELLTEISGTRRDPASAPRSDRA
jgi:septum formation protein